MYTFHKTSGERGPQKRSAASSGYTQRFRIHRKKCNQKINPPKQKGRKKSELFPAQESLGQHLHRFPPVKFSKFVLLSLS